MEEIIVYYNKISIVLEYNNNSWNNWGIVGYKFKENNSKNNIAIRNHNINIMKR